MRLDLNLLLILFVVFITSTSCGNDEKQALRSLRGNWNVVFINTHYGEFTNNGFNYLETITEDGDLGSYTFTEDSVSFNFTRNDTLLSGNEIYSFEHERVNAGFTRVNQFTLSYPPDFVFVIEFEDGTSNSEKNANFMSMVQIADQAQSVLMEIHLEKE